MEPQHDPEVTMDDIRSLARYFKKIPGIYPKLVMIHYLGPNQFRVFLKYRFFDVERDEESGWKIKDKGTWVA